MERGQHFLLLSNDGRLRPGWRFLLAALVVYSANYVAALSAYAIHPELDMAFEGIFRPVLAMIELGMFAFFVRVLDREQASLPGLGLDVKRPWFREFYGGLLFGAALVTLGVLLVAVLGSYRVMHRQWTGRSALLVIWVLLNAALAEELGFRSYPFLRLVEAARRPGIAIFLTAVLFGAEHLRNPYADWVSTTNTVLIGILFSVVFLRSGSLWLVWGIHLGWNLTLGVIFGLPVSGLTEFMSGIHGYAYGPEWLTGGEYGIEGGLAGTVAIVAGLLTARRLWPPVAAEVVSTKSPQEDLPYSI